MKRLALLLILLGTLLQSTFAMEFDSPEELLQFTGAAFKKAIEEGSVGDLADLMELDESLSEANLEKIAEQVFARWVQSLEARERAGKPTKFIYVKPTELEEALAGMSPGAMKVAESVITSTLKAKVVNLKKAKFDGLLMVKNATGTSVCFHAVGKLPSGSYVFMEGL